MPEIRNFPKVEFFLSFSKIILRIFQKSTKHDSEKTDFFEIFYVFFSGILRNRTGAEVEKVRHFSEKKHRKTR